MLKTLSILLVGFFHHQNVSAKTVHPHILVHPRDKQIILQKIDKIDKQEWAKKVFARMIATV